MRDAEIEGAAQHGARVFEVIHAAEVVPQSERHGGKLDTAAPRAAILHGVVALVIYDVHEGSPQRLKAHSNDASTAALKGRATQNPVRSHAHAEALRPQNHVRVFPQPVKALP